MYPAMPAVDGTAAKRGIPSESGDKAWPGTQRDASSGWHGCETWDPI